MADKYSGPAKTPTAAASALPSTVPGGGRVPDSTGAPGSAAASTSTDATTSPGQLPATVPGGGRVPDGTGAPGSSAASGHDPEAGAGTVTVAEVADSPGSGKSGIGFTTGPTNTIPAGGNPSTHPVTKGSLPSGTGAGDGGIRRGRVH